MTLQITEGVCGYVDEGNVLGGISSREGRYGADRESIRRCNFGE